VRFNDFYLQLISVKWFWLKSVVVLVFLFSSVILLVNSRCSSLMFNHHLINSLIISLTLTLLQCFFNTIQRGTKCTLSRVDLTLGILLCSIKLLSRSSKLICGQFLKAVFKTNVLCKCVYFNRAVAPDAL